MEPVRSVFPNHSLQANKNGAPDRIRTCDPQIRHTTTFIATPKLWGVCALDFLFIIPTNVGLDATRKVSTPFPNRTWLGIAILQVSPTLSGSTLRVSSKAPNFLGIWCSIQLSYGR